MSKKKDGSESGIDSVVVDAPAPEPVSQEPIEAQVTSVAEPTPAPPEPTPINEVSKVIAEIQTEPGYVHQSAEHLEFKAVRKLVDELGWDLRRAEVAVRAHLF